MRQFKKGDRVRVLTLAEMRARGAEDYDGYNEGLDLDDERTNYIFNKAMYPVCGFEFTITEEPEYGDIHSFPEEQLLGNCDEIFPSSTSCSPITNFMVELVQSKYPSNNMRKSHAT